MKTLKVLFFLWPLLPALFFDAYAQRPNPEKALEGFDKYMDKLLTDWNVPGAGVGIIYKDKLVYAKGFGYRDYGNRLPITKNTLFQIASNTKLFTTIAAGMLVEEGVLSWDRPIKEHVPEIEFANRFLNENVTLRDMLGHKTGISRHDMIWFKSDFTRKELFERIRYMEPSVPLRTNLLYNNMMYTAVGYIIELKTGKTWEEFVTERILKPLEMQHTVFSIKKMQEFKDHGVPYNERRDTTILYKAELKEDGHAVGPAGAIISTIEDLSHWTSTLMNSGVYKGKEVIPPAIIRETLKPGIALRNTDLEEKGYKEVLNTTFASGRVTASYKGNFITYHGGSMPGFMSRVAILPVDSIAIVTFGLGDHSGVLPEIITFNVIDRLSGQEQTDWSARRLETRNAGRAESRKARSQEGYDRKTGTKPTHDLSEYAGTFTNPAYGNLVVRLKEESLLFNFRKTELPLAHYHYNRFDTPNDEDFGKWSLNFLINPQGDINSAVVSIDQKQVEFVKQPDESLSDPRILEKYTGRYDDSGYKLEVRLIEGKLTILGTVNRVLIPHRAHIFRVKDFDDMLIEFSLEHNVVSAIQYKVPSGIYTYKKIR